ncbi:MAG TPA: FAD/NAD(P)-binding oxidoreductase [Pseudonocardiaceae bacterium]|nr:FAD/NAD(P)-binding oxidoreductase [Pseudonocardiaceae bacterium]
MRCDVAILGAGPAGLAAAGAAVAAGKSVIVLDLGTRPGGQYFRHPNGKPTKELAGLLSACRGTRMLLGRKVFLVEQGPPSTIHVVDGEPVVTDSVIIATGAHDRVVPFPGWDLPGVLTAGGAQALWKGSRVLPGKRIVVGGTGPFLLPVAAGLASAGADVVGVFEANDPRRFARFPMTLARNPGKLLEAAGYLGTLARHRVPIRNRRAVVAAHGEGGVTAVTVARVDADWRPVPGTERLIDCDTVAIGCGFVPQIDIALALGCASEVAADGTVVLTVDGKQRTSVPGVYAAGEVTGIGGVRMSLAEGAIAGRVGAPGPGRSARQAEFARALAAVYPVREGWLDWLAGDTLLCRCEEVDYDAVRAAAGLGARDARAVKLLTRAGMGWCQGRMCAGAVACAINVPVEPARRILAQPIRLGDLAEPLAEPTEESR